MNMETESFYERSTKTHGVTIQKKTCRADLVDQ